MMIVHVQGLETANQVLQEVRPLENWLRPLESSEGLVPLGEAVASFRI